MTEILFLLLLPPVLLGFWFLLFPVRFARGARTSELILDPPEGFVYSFVIHIHTQFSYDSLGTPEDVMRTRDRCGIDYAVVTDHDNDHIKAFADERLVAGREIKINDEEGNLLGDILEVGDLKIVAHHLKGKYRWKLEKRRDYLFELVDLRDSLLERKWKLLAYVISALILYPVLGKKRVLGHFTKLVNVEGYVRKFFEEGWRSRVVGGLDHHVKLYLREVGKRVLVPSYELSFSLVRNFLLSKDQINDKEKFIEALKGGINLISFCEKPSFVWIEGGRIKVYSPFGNTYVVVVSERGKRWEFLGSNIEFGPEDEGYYLVIGYTYAFKLGSVLFGLKPLFVSDLLEVSRCPRLRSLFPSG